jgi:hypothetical protein
MDDIIWYERRIFYGGPVPLGEDLSEFVPLDSQTGARIPGVGTKRYRELLPGEKVKFLGSDRIEVHLVNAEDEEQTSSAYGEEGDQTFSGYELDEEGKPIQFKPTPVPPKLTPLPTPLPPKPTPLPSKAEIERTRMNPEALKNIKLDYLLPKVSQFPKERFLRWGEKGRDGKFILDPNDDLRDDFFYFVTANGMIPMVSVYPEKHEIILTKRNTDPTAKNSETLYLSHYLIGSKNDKIYNKVADFMKREPYFAYDYRTKLPTTKESAEGHIVLMKQHNSFTLVVSDSTGNPWVTAGRKMTPNTVILTDILFKRAGFVEFKDDSCRLQTTRGTCSLWTILAALYPKKSSGEIKNMIDVVIEKVGLPPGAETYDMVIKEIAYEFMVNPILASSVNKEEYMQGFGKLKGGISVDHFIELENKFKEDIKRNRNNKDKVLKQLNKFLYDVLENLDQNQEKHRARLEVIIEKLMTNAGLSFELNIAKLFPRQLYDAFYDTLFPEPPVLPTEPLEKPIKQPPKGFEPPPPKKGGKLNGKAMPEGLIPLQQMAKEAYNLVDPKKEINGWELKQWTPTLKFYVKGNEVIIAVRGTKANAPDGSLDVTADLTIPFNGIPGTIRYKTDKAMIENFQKQYYPPSQYSYFAVGHSLGGAIIDSLIRDRLIREAVSYNPAIQFSDINRGLPNRRIYYGSDPLYRLMGWWDVKSEHREPENRTWADFLSGISLPAAAIAALPAHNLSNFEGGRRVSFT